jgi:hypothetical protein
LSEITADPWGLYATPAEQHSTRRGDSGGCKCGCCLKWASTFTSTNQRCWAIPPINATWWADEHYTDRYALQTLAQCTAATSLVRTDPIWRVVQSRQRLQHTAFSAEFAGWCADFTVGILEAKQRLAWASLLLLPDYDPLHPAAAAPVTHPIADCVNIFDESSAALLRQQLLIGSTPDQFALYDQAPSTPCENTVSVIVLHDIASLLQHNLATLPPWCPETRHDTLYAPCAQLKDPSQFCLCWHRPGKQANLSPNKRRRIQDGANGGWATANTNLSVTTQSTLERLPTPLNVLIDLLEGSFNKHQQWTATTLEQRAAFHARQAAAKLYRADLDDLDKLYLGSEYSGLHLYYQEPVPCGASWFTNRIDSFSDGLCESPLGWGGQPVNQ